MDSALGARENGTLPSETVCLVPDPRPQGTRANRNSKY
jgi:hypothetical protein